MLRQAGVPRLPLNRSNFFEHNVNNYYKLHFIIIVNMSNIHAFNGYA